MMFNLGKKESEKLKVSFGEIKDGPFDFGYCFFSLHLRGGPLQVKVDGTQAIP